MGILTVGKYKSFFGNRWEDKQSGELGCEDMLSNELGSLNTLRISAQQTSFGSPLPISFGEVFGLKKNRG